MLELFLVYELYLVYLGAKVRVAALLLLAGRLLAHPGGGGSATSTWEGSRLLSSVAYP